MITFLIDILATMRAKQISLEVEQKNADFKLTQLKTSNDQIMLDRLLGCLEYFAIRQIQSTAVIDKKLFDRILVAGKLAVGVITGRRTIG